MSKLSVALKEAINAAHAKPFTIAAPANIRSVYKKIEDEAAEKNVGQDAWLTMSTAATMTMNSPDSLTELYKLATSAQSVADSVLTAELMREVGLKCISFNGIPRTINILGAFRASLPAEITSSLATKSTRTPTPDNIAAITERGNALWKSIYTPFDGKLINKLADSHPDLPVHILNSHYGALLSDPSPPISKRPVGRALTSVVGICCLRAQTGVGPQVTSHIFGLRKAFEGDGSGKGEFEGGEWLASDEGNLWILKSVDSIVEAIGGGLGTSFAPGIKAKL